MHIKVSRYPDPKAVGYAGWIEPADKTWIAFIDLGGAPTFFLHRDPETGGVLSNDVATHPAEIAAIRAEQARRAAWVEPVEGVHYPALPGEGFAGRVVPPTGIDP